MDPDYSNRELDQRFDSIEKTSNDNRVLLMGKLEEIHEQTKKTNGRVSKLELWQNRVLGFCAAVSLLLLPLLFFVIEKRI